MDNHGILGRVPAAEREARCGLRQLAPAVWSLGSMEFIWVWINTY